MKRTNIRLRIILGGVVIVAAVAVLGFLSRASFDRIDQHAATLNQRSLPAIRQSVGLARAAVDCVSRPVDAAPENLQEARAKLTELNASLDQIAALARQSGDSTLDKQTGEIRSLSAQWMRLFEQASANIDANTSAAIDLAGKANGLLEAADAGLSAKNAEQALAQAVIAQVAKINGLAAETRMNGDAWVLSGDPKRFDLVQTNIAALSLALDQLKLTDPAAQTAMADIRKTSADFANATKAWGEKRKVAAAVFVGSQSACEEFLKRNAEFVAKKEKDYRATTNETAKAAALELMLAGNRITEHARSAVLNAKQYMLATTPESWQAVSDSLDRLLKSSGELRGLVADDADRKAADASLVAAQEFLATAKTWTEADRQAKAAAGIVNAGGDPMVNAAAALQSAVSSRVDKSGTEAARLVNIGSATRQFVLDLRSCIQNPDSKTLTSLTDSATKLAALYSGLEKETQNTADQQRAEAATKQINTLLTAAKSWVQSANDFRQTTLPEVRRAGQAVIAAAQTAENEALRISGESASSVASVVADSKGSVQSVFIVALAAGIAAMIFILYSLATCVTRPMRSLAETLASSSEQTVSAAAQMAGSSQSLAERASQQAAALQETNSSLEGMSVMTQRSVQNAESARELARQTRQAADAGASDMSAMDAAMNDIKNAGGDIAKIIKTIDEIAFQTNILALNAAVEAARAGAAGTGFAVVADEVRNLAQRSAQAARETADKIESAITKTQQGVQLSSKVSAHLHEIVSKIHRVDELVAEVAVASHEQSQGIEHVNAALRQMDELTQSNAANAQESASAAAQLNAQAGALEDAVGQLLLMVDQREPEPQKPAPALPPAPQPRARLAAPNTRMAIQKSAPRTRL